MDWYGEATASGAIFSFRQAASAASKSRRRPIRSNADRRCQTGGRSGARVEKRYSWGHPDHLTANPEAGKEISIKDWHQRFNFAQFLFQPEENHHPGGARDAVFQRRPCRPAAVRVGRRHPDAASRAAVAPRQLPAEPSAGGFARLFRRGGPRLRRSGLDIVSLDEMYRRLTQRDFKRRFVCLTFDDGYRDNLQWAYPILKKHEVPFALYVPTSFPDRIGEIWWVALERVIANNDRIGLYDRRPRPALRLRDVRTRRRISTSSSIGGCAASKPRTSCAA